MSARTGEKGQGIIEFSVVSVIILFLIFTVIEVSRMVLVFTTIANAARAGVRYACVHGSDRTGTGITGPSGPGSNPAEVVAVVSLDGRKIGSGEPGPVTRDLLERFRALTRSGA